MERVRQELKKATVSAFSPPIPYEREVSCARVFFELAYPLDDRAYEDIVVNGSQRDDTGKGW